MRKSILFILILVVAVGFSVQAQTNTLIINTDQSKSKISRYIYGQFAEHLGRGVYGGLWVGKDSDIPNTDGFRNDVLKALKELEVPDVRWPGGCFADEYHWRNGIGPEEDRPVTVNTHWGMVAEHNQVGTHEFMRLTELLDTEPYISANVGSGTVKEMADWIEYLTYAGNSTLADLRRKNGREEAWKVKFLGIGNESWGCGGNMTADYYANLFKRYATFAKNFSGNDLYKIASGFSEDHYEWTEILMKKAGWAMDAISLHYYTIATGEWRHKGSSTDFEEDQYFSALRNARKMDEYIQGHSTIMDKYDPEKRVALAVDEWGIWTDPLPDTNPGFLEQQNSLRDALIASETLDILNKHSDRVRMANIAQMVNVLQAMVLTKGKQMIKTPTYYVFDMYKVHHDAMLLSGSLESAKYSLKGDNIPAISTTASKDSTGVVNLTISNIDPDNVQEVKCYIRGMQVKSVSNSKILTGDKINSINTFDNPDNIKPEEFTDYSLKNNVVTLRLPSKSVIVLSLN